MNEFEWLYRGDPEAMLTFMHGAPSARKLRLFICACCRGVLDVSAGERYADGEATQEQVGAAAEAAAEAAERAGDEYMARVAAEWATALVEASTGLTVDIAGAMQATAADAGMERRRQCGLLHDLFGNPFQPRRLDAAWLRWNDGAVRKMAQAIYDESRFEDLPVVADALEEAGCDDAFLLYHCRDGGEHVRGCWAVDLLLGRA